MMHKHAKMLYDILKGYTEGLGVRTITLTGWDMTHEMGKGIDGKVVVQHPKTKFHVTFTIWRENVLNYTYYSNQTLEFPEIVNVKYLYRALHELAITHHVGNNIKDAEVYKVLGTAEPVTAWDLLMKDTDFEALEI